MKPFAAILILLQFLAYAAKAQNVPEGYILQYEQNFSNSRALGDFRFSRPQSWSIVRAGNNYYLQYSSDSGYVPDVPSPENIGILSPFIFGDFIMELDVMPLSSGNGLKEICILSVVRDSLQYYYMQLANVTDSLSNGIFLVNRTTCSKISVSEPEPFAFTENKWNHVRIERDIVRRTFKVYWQNMPEPVMESRDFELVMGYIGFGGYAGSGGFDNIRIWAPTSIPEDCLIFQTK